MSIYTLGIDVSKARLDLALLDVVNGTVEMMAVDNTGIGHAEIVNWINANAASNVHVCLEATGTYGDAVAEHLYSAGHMISIINPLKAKRFSQMQMKRTNTDQVDAKLLAKLCYIENLELWKPLSTAKKELKELVSARKAYVKERTSCRNRLQSPSTSTTVDQIHQKHIQHLDELINEIEQAIDALTQGDENLNREVALLTSIPGIGKKTAISALVAIGDINRFDKADQLVSFAGLAPGSKTSGSSVNQKYKMASFGKRTLRTDMYLPACTAKRYNPIMKSLVQRLEAAGKPPMVIIGAVMRKLMRLIFGILKSGVPFDPNYLNRQAISA